MILSSHIADLLNEAEVRFPVDLWEIAGVHAWPLLRIRYGFGLIEEHGYRSRTTPSHAGRVLDSIGGPLRRLVASVQDHTRNASLNLPAEVVLLSDGISYAKVGGLWHEKFCDPLIPAFEQHRLRCLLLSPLHAYRVPRRTPSHFIQPELDRIAVRAAASGDDAANLPDFDAFQRWAESRGTPAPSQHWLQQACTRLRMSARYFRNLLDRAGAALGVVVNYYSPVGMGYVLACRELGVPVVDIQHGVGGDLHFAYGRWLRGPAEGYNLLPTHFWCWDAESAAAIQAWAPKAHSTVVGGNPWLSYWQNESAPHVREADARIAAIKAQHPSATHILLTLQFPVDTDQTRAVLDAVRAAGPETFWWIRLHPTLLAERERVAALFCATGRAELATATELALPALLRHMDVHVTHSSSTVLEADTMGVPSVITSRYGAELYPAQVRSGMAVEVAPEELARAVQGQARRKGSLPTPRPAEMQTAIEQLLETTRLRSAVEVALSH